MPHLENPGKNDSIFVDINVKDLPLDIQKRHRARRKKMDRLSKQIESVREQGEKDINTLIKG